MEDLKQGFDVLFTYKKSVIRNLCYVTLFALLYVPYGDLATTISMPAFKSDFMFVLVIPFLHLYNGEHGPHTKFSKYFFYAFYSAHLWLLAAIEHFIS